MVTSPSIPSCLAEVFAGPSEPAERLRLQVTRIAPHLRTALLSGEAGSGKQTVARELHRLGGAHTLPFVARDVDEFARSTDRVAPSGVLYLYGLERLEPGLQQELTRRLRMIQREMRVLFGSRVELRALLATGRLRQQLAARVGAIEIRVPALRDRVDDLECLAGLMLVRAGSAGVLGEAALDELRGHTWPENLAELRRMMEQVAGVPGAIAPGDLPGFAVAAPGAVSAVRLEDVMQRHVFEVLERCSGNKLRAAEMLGISRSTLYRMLEATAE